MKIDRPLFEQMCRLAKLSFREEEIPALMNDLNRILEFMDKLREVDTTGVEPLVHLNPQENAERADQPSEGLDREEVLRLAPEQQQGFFVVPAVLPKKV